MKKVIGITIIIVVLLVLVGVYFINNKTLSKDEFMALMQSFEEVDNIKLETDEVTIYIKDEIRSTKSKDGIYGWIDSKNNECISYMPESKEYVVYTYTDAEHEFSELENATYNFVGYEEYNNTRCAIGEFAIMEDLKVRIWLDSKNGTYLKVVNTGKDYLGNEYEQIEEYTATYGIVTDEDVKKPDLEGYTEIEI